MKLNKSLGQDKILIIVIKRVTINNSTGTNKSIYLQTTYILIKLTKTTDWKSSNIILLYKKEKRPNIQNYSPVYQKWSQSLYEKRFN